MMKKGLFRSILDWVLLVVTISIWVNLIRQWGNLWEATKKVAENEDKIDKLIEENRKLTQRIKYSTSSAYLEQEARDKLGLGGSNDYWLVLPPEDKNLNLYPKVNEVVKKPAWKQWWELFAGPGVEPGL